MKAIPQPGASSAPSEPVASILLVDDHRPNLLALEAVLDPLRQRLVTAQSGEEALERLAREEFALILMDVKMRGIDGFETAARVRGLDQARHTPIIFISGLPEDEDRLYRGYAQGAVDYVVKPFNPDILRAKVAVFVELHRRAEQIKRQEAALRQLEREASDEVFRRIMDTSMMGLLFSDYEGRVLEANDAFLSMLGYTREDLKAGVLAWQQLSPPEYEHVHHAAIQELSTQGVTRQFEKEYIRKDGTRVAVLVGSARVEKQRRNLTYVLDISERKRAEANVSLLASAGEILSSSLDFRETLAQLARLVVPVLADWCAVDIQAQDGAIQRVAVLHTDPRKVELVQQIEERYPVDPGAPRGVPNVLRTGETEWTPEITDAVLVAIARDEEHLRMARELGLRSAVVVPLAARGRVLGAMTLVQAESGRRYTKADVQFAEELARRAALSVENALLFEREVTVRKEVETLAEELKHSEAQFRLLAETMPQLVWTNRPDGHHEYFNQRWYDYTGMSPEETAGEGWSRMLHPEEHERAIETWRQALRTGEPYESQCRLRRADGTYRWFIGRAVAARDGSGRIVRWFGTYTDIDDQKRAEEERQRLVQALERSNKELDQFAYVTSHDLKAPLRGIANLSQWIEEDLNDKMTDESRKQLDLLRGRVHRLENLIDGILSYSRAGRIREKAEAIDVGRLLREMVELLAPPPETRVEIAPDMPVIVTERTPLQQTFLNLISNALKHAGRADPEVRIGVRDAGSYWEFSVSDNGSGIAPEYHDRIWGIFQTLKARDKVEGTGIGLSVVQKIVQSKGARAWVESALGAGATFRFTWPKIEAREPSSPG
ncbi:histidine kinase [Sorangium cellulosum]|uniref:histidine kinase n=1 Tax=Sorangium cellulosum TaxID=56 RepID=A0A2L0EZX3_SORCE|nr:PAS domain S-box protein [Sorangium cellulosum]AUX44826.1 histidine kinase [Sorangium cellulosum]